MSKSPMFHLPASLLGVEDFSGGHDQIRGVVGKFIERFDNIVLGDRGLQNDGTNFANFFADIVQGKGFGSSKGPVKN